jgi:hypothetical protein
MKSRIMDAEEQAQSRCRCRRGEPSPADDVAGVSRVPVQRWQGVTSPGAARGLAQFQRRCGMGEHTPSVNVGQGRAQSRRRCGRGEPSPGADVAGVSPVLVCRKWEG